MNRYAQEPAPDDAPEEEEVFSLPDPNADDDQVFAPEESIPQTAAGAGAPPPPVATTPLSDPAELARQNELLKQQVAQSRQAQQQVAAGQVQAWLASLPDDKRDAARRLIEDHMREAEDKRRVMWTIAQQNALEGTQLQEFYEVAQGVADPTTMERLGARYKRFMELEKGTTVTPKPKPAMASVRPDAGAPQGNRAGSQRKRQEEILAPYMGGGAKQGNLVELEMELERHGKYGRSA